MIGTLALVEIIQDEALCLYGKGETDGGWHVKVSLPKQRLPETRVPKPTGCGYRKLHLGLDDIKKTMPLVNDVLPGFMEG